MKWGKRLGAAVPALLISDLASAHSFGTIYNLPIPVWLYLYGAAGALVISFVIVGFFVTARSIDLNFRTREIGRGRVVNALTGARAILLGRLLSTSALLLSITSGFVGSGDSYANINMTLFWIVFLLGFAYLVALVGDLYAAINPWRALAEWIESASPGLFAGRRRYPETLGHYPALALYMALIWFELFGGTKPHSLSAILSAYTALTFAGAWWWGKDAWFRYGEFFGPFMGLTAKMAPITLARDDTGAHRLLLRQPFIGLLDGRTESRSQLVFVLFMLSSTAFDGIRETAVWVGLYWKDFYHLVGPAPGPDFVKAYAASYPFFQGLYLAFQSTAIVLSPFAYIGVYLSFIWLAKKISGSARSVSDLALDFGYSLIPIAFVYNLTHYFTLLISQGPRIVKLLADPFGFGWNPHVAKSWLAQGVWLDAGTVWHIQVALILMGHIVSVYLAHLMALRLFPTQRQATLSQLPMLILMVVLTSVGLWILSQPVSSGQYIVPNKQSLLEFQSAPWSHLA